jgi:serine/threonine protein kinase
VSSAQYLIGKTLDKYEVLEHIGHGGMSEVYRGQQAQLDRMVAIKVLHPFLADEEGFVVRFQREARIVATLRHPNIVQVYDFDHNDELDIYYMVMEFIDGPTLKNRLEEAPLTPEETARIGASVADALDYAHHLSMVHRDVKPANIMFLDEHQPVLTDFGIAKMLTLSGITASGAMVGTPAYMAPEIGIGKPGTALSDIYSLSVVLYQMTAGCLPFTAETPIGMVMQHINKEPPSPSLYNRDIPIALEKAILRGLRKEPKERYRDAGEMAAALREAIGLPANGGQGGVPPTSPRPATPDGIPGEAATSVVESDSVDRAHVATEEEAAAQRDVDLAGKQALVDAGLAGAPDDDAATSAVPPAVVARSWSLLSRRTIDEAPESAGDTAGPRATTPRRTKSRLWPALRSVLVLLIVTGIGGGIWYNRSDGFPPVVQNLLVAGSAAAPDPVETTPAVAALTPTEPATALPPEPTATRPPSPAAAVATPTAACAVRVRLDKIDIQPDTIVSPGASVVAYITLRNSGTCTWPQAIKMIFAEGDLLAAPASFPVAALAPGQKIQFIVPMTAPEELGTYQTVWELLQADGSVLGSGSSGRFTVDLAVEDIPAVGSTLAAEFVFEKATRTPLAVGEPALLSWELIPSRDLWTGVAVITASGGSGDYTYYQDRISAVTELPDGALSFEWRRCKPYPLEVWILSGEDVLDWQGTIAFPDADTCP